MDFTSFVKIFFYLFIFYLGFAFMQIHKENTVEKINYQKEVEYMQQKQQILSLFK